MQPLHSRRAQVPAGNAVPASTAWTAEHAVLLVDDDEEMREIVRTVLVEAGYEVLPAATGAEALRLLREHGTGIGLMIADYVMPGMNGLELLRTARALWPRLPILLVSGYARIDSVREFAHPAAAGFLRKPFRPAELLARVAEVSRSGRGEH